MVEEPSLAAGARETEKQDQRIVCTMNDSLHPGLILGDQPLTPASF